MLDNQCFAKVLIFSKFFENIELTPISLFFAAKRAILT